MSKYVTTDTALAAWLQIQGIHLIRINSDGFPSSFEFENEDNRASKLASSFHIGQAEGNIFQFFRAYRHLLSEIRTGDNNSGPG